MLAWLFTGGWLPGVLIAMSLFFVFYLRGIPFRAPRRMLASLRGSNTDGVSPFRAMTLALAGTLGVGNIVGVANAISIGGAGSILWMWISALAAMVLKYAEVVLAIRHRRTGNNGERFGGAVYYIRDYFSGRRLRLLGAILSATFALLMILDALAMGCVIQVRAVSSSFFGVFGVPTWICGGMLAMLLIPALAKGARGISALTEVLIPILTLGYLILTVAVLLLRPQECKAAFRLILADGFSGESVAGGVIGFLTSRVLRVGTMRGLLSNEAGCGTAPTAHASSNASSSVQQGIFGILEVFVDTILLCTATALVILCSFSEVGHLGGDPVMMSIRAYSTVLGGWSEGFFCIAILCFGYGTVLCWSGYGAECVKALSKKPHWRILYSASVVLSVAVGASFAPEAVWSISDFAISSLTGINLWMLFLMRREVKEESEFWLHQGRMNNKEAKILRRSDEGMKKV